MGKSVLITGVNGGIGTALVNVFREGGFTVVGLDIAVDPVAECHVYVQCDLDQYVVEKEYRDKIDQYFNAHISRLDVLVNNAAVQLLDHFESMSIEDWQKTMNVNLTAPFLLAQFFLEMLEDKQGSIINIGSIHHQLTKPRFTAYATSKSGLVGLTKAMAVDLQGKVRVNAISPAAIGTPMLLDGFDGNEAALEELKKIHPVQRIGYPEEVAKLALFLAEDNNGFIHGANISLDGGISSVLKDL